MATGRDHAEVKSSEPGYHVRSQLHGQHASCDGDLAATLRNDRNIGVRSCVDGIGFANPNGRPTAQVRERSGGSGRRGRTANQGEKRCLLEVPGADDRTNRDMRTIVKGQAVKAELKYGWVPFQDGYMAFAPENDRDRILTKAAKYPAE
jgi:hypothetical protein